MDLPPSTASGLATLEQEKASRNPARQELDSNLVPGLRQGRLEPPFDRPGRLQPTLSVLPGGRVLVDLDATVSTNLLVYIRCIGGEVINHFASARAVQAIVPLKSLEALAARGDVKFISPGALATTNPMTCSALEPVETTNTRP